MRHSLVRVYWLIAACVASPCVYATGSAPELIPSPIARRLLESSPGVGAARANMEVAGHEARILTESPYEWSARATAKRRTVRDATAGADYNEWNVGTERTVRPPGRGVVDRDIASLIEQEAHARYNEALQDGARTLLSSWIDAAAAAKANELAMSAQRAAEESLRAAEKRLRAGDASHLELNLARADTLEQQRLYAETTTLSSTARRRFAARYPSAESVQFTWPALPVLAKSEHVWQKRIAAESNELKVAHTRLQVAQKTAERAREDRIPDPTVGLYASVEAGGRERVAGISVSVPLPGPARNLRSTKAAASVSVAQQERDAIRQRVRVDVAGNVAATAGALEVATLARASAAAMSHNATLMQRAYDLGELDLQTLLQARRQSTAAAVTALQAETGAIKAYNGLLLEAHLIWELGRD